MNDIKINYIDIFNLCVEKYVEKNIHVPHIKISVGENEIYDIYLNYVHLQIKNEYVYKKSISDSWNAYNSTTDEFDTFWDKSVENTQRYELTDIDMVEVNSLCETYNYISIDELVDILMGISKSYKQWEYEISNREFKETNISATGIVNCPTGKMACLFTLPNEIETEIFEYYLSNIESIPNRKRYNEIYMKLLRQHNIMYGNIPNSATLLTIENDVYRIGAHKLTANEQIIGEVDQMYIIVDKEYLKNIEHSKDYTEFDIPIGQYQVTHYYGMAESPILDVYAEFKKIE